MSEERRRDQIAFGGVVTDLSRTVGDLRDTVVELKTTVIAMKERDTEDRQEARETSKDVQDLKQWRSRIRGQIAVLWALVAVFGGTLVARILKIIP